MNWKKKDAVLILTVLLIAGAAFGVHEFAGGDGADTVTVKVEFAIMLSALKIKKIWEYR